VSTEQRVLLIYMTSKEHTVIPHTSIT